MTLWSRLSKMHVMTGIWYKSLTNMGGSFGWKKNEKHWKIITITTKTIPENEPGCLCLINYIVSIGSHFLGGPPRGGTWDFKWREWSNGGKNCNPKKIPRASNKTPKNPQIKNWPLKITTAKHVCLYFIRRATQPMHYQESSDCFKYPKTSRLK